MKNEKGYTIIEVVIAILILFVCVTGYFQFLESYKISRNGTGEFTTAKNLNINGIETMRNQVLTSLSPPIGKTETIYIEVNGKVFETTMSLADYSNSTNFNVKTPIYRVSSVTKWGEKKLEAETYVSYRKK